MNRVYIAGKSNKTWSQLPPILKLQYKFKLIQLHGLECDKRYGNGCGKKCAVGQLSVDHVIPISMGGSVCDIHNMQLLCFKCHQRKTRNIDRRNSD
jgi:5-methylcytosine-specific restriction endonuclease McrA